MVLKAARGAGVPLGHCEDLATATGYLAATDPVALTCLTDVLAGPFRSPMVVIAENQMLITQAQAVMAAPLAVDALRAGITQIVFEGLEAPQIVFALCAVSQIGVSHRFDSQTLIITPVAAVPICPPAAPVTIAQSLWDKLAALAAQTYVPATDASRNAGAGAGLTDND